MVRPSTPKLGCWLAVIFGLCGLVAGWIYGANWAIRSGTSGDGLAGLGSLLQDMERLLKVTGGGLLYGLPAGLCWATVGFFLTPWLSRSRQPVLASIAVALVAPIASALVAGLQRDQVVQLRVANTRRAIAQYQEEVESDRSRVAAFALNMGDLRYPDSQETGTPGTGKIRLYTADERKAVERYYTELIGEHYLLYEPNNPDLMSSREFNYGAYHGTVDIEPTRTGQPGTNITITVLDW